MSQGDEMKLFLAGFIFMIVVPLILLGTARMIETSNKPAYEKAVKTVAKYCRANCRSKWLGLIEVGYGDTEFICVCKKDKP